ncbi:conserved hypothetical protein [Stigmatella aurantiaca DW4/3-1]|uniref:Uncharacterized protein n=1 Tax=Stigmatella aurantiaca (strain DW4/3-1) TaxID=378806 RepID=Q08T54_STIAD|nr:conserved hypothetical protein [Stigmatella aurantiaca DW4/3-1]
MPGLIRGNLSHRLANPLIARVRGLVVRHQRAERLAHASLHDVVQGHLEQGAQGQRFHPGRGGRGAEAPGQAGGDIRVLDLLPGAPQRGILEDGIGTVERQLLAQPEEGIDGRRFQVGGRREMAAQRVRAVHRFRRPQPHGAAPNGAVVTPPLDDLAAHLFQLPRGGDLQLKPRHLRALSTGEATGGDEAEAAVRVQPHRAALRVVAIQVVAFREGDQHRLLSRIHGAQKALEGLQRCMRGDVIASRRRQIVRAADVSADPVEAALRRQILQGGLAHRGVGSRRANGPRGTHLAVHLRVLTDDRGDPQLHAIHRCGRRQAAHREPTAFAGRRCVARQIQVPLSAPRQHQRGHERGAQGLQEEAIDGGRVHGWLQRKWEAFALSNEGAKPSPRARGASGPGGTRPGRRGRLKNLRAPGPRTPQSTLRKKYNTRSSTFCQSGL